MDGLDKFLRGADILIIAPHADDEALGCGGIIDQAKTRGDKVRVLIGTIGGFVTENGGTDSISQQRLAELAEAMRRAGIQEYLAWDPSGKHHLQLDHVPVAELVKWIERSHYGLLERRPDVVLVPSAQHNHQDHQAINRAAIAAMRTNPKLRSLAVLEYEIPGTGQTGFDVFDPNAYFELSEQNLHAKITHFEAYKSQVAPTPHLRSTHAIRTLACFRGLEAGFAYAEAYRILRLKTATSVDQVRIIAQQLYLDGQRGLEDVRTRLATNTSNGSFDLQSTLATWLDLARGEKVLDVGCGTGQHLANFATQHGIFPYGVDIALNRCLDTRIRFAVSSGDRLPFGDAEFDKTTCNYALYYLNDWSDAFEEMARVTRHGGKILITGPADDNNSQLYGLHMEAFGGISQIDRVALGFLQSDLEPYLDKKNLRYDARTFENQVTFGSAEEFMAYYRSTSLWRCKESQRGSESIEVIEELVRRHFANERRFTNTKRVRFVRVEV